MNAYDRIPAQRSEALPTARYVLTVDHQAKRSFDRREAAEAEALRIRERFPNLLVRVLDCRDRRASAGRGRA